MAEKYCQNCLYADFRFNYASVGSCDSIFRCGRDNGQVRHFDSCQHWRDRFAEEDSDV